MDSQYQTQTAPAPDSGNLAYERSPFNSWPAHIWMLTQDAMMVERTTYNTGTGDRFPSWSPGGTLLTFTRDMTSSTTDLSYDIFTMLADGSGVKRLTTNSAADYNSSFSPDGSRIVFTSNRAGNPEIHTMKIDGTDVRRLTTNAAYDSQARWSPDGKKIAFVSDRAGNDEIYAMNVDGSDVTRLTKNPAEDFAPDWDPDGTQLIFSTKRNGHYDVYWMTGDAVVSRNETAGWSFDAFEGHYRAEASAFVATVDPFGDYDLYSNTLLVGGSDRPLVETEDDESNGDWQPIPAFPLVDARFSSFKADIEWVYNEGITKGCSAERYCPTDPVTREQMAIFLDRALHLPTTTTDYFSDDTGRTGEAAINRVAAAGITSGCAAGKYCPTDTVTRGAMASFLARAFALPATTTDYFTDDNGTTHEVNINRVAAAGITSGCTPTTYCPTADVTRGQMAAFLRRALE